MGSFLWWYLGLGVHVLVLEQDSKTQFSPLKAHDVGQEAELRRTNQSGAYPPPYTAVAVSKHQLAEDRTPDWSISDLVSLLSTLHGDTDPEKGRDLSKLSV